MLIGSTSNLSALKKERLNRMDFEERKRVLRNQIAFAEWLLEPPGEYHVSFSMLHEIHDVSKVERMLQRWALRQSSLLKSNIAYRGILTGKHRPHIHLIVWGRNRSGLTLKENHRCPKWFWEYEQRGWWPGTMFHAPIYNQEGLAVYIAVNNFNEMTFEPLQYATSKSLLKGDLHA